MAQATTRKPPASATRSITARQSSAAMLGGVVFLLLLVLYLLLMIPSPLFGFHWQTTLFGPIRHVLFATLPPPTADVPAWVPRVPLLQWVIWAWQAWWCSLIVTLLQHLLSLHAQVTKQAAAHRTYALVRIPASETVESLAGTGILRSLHGMLPPRKQPTDPPPLVLRWSGVPNEPIRQGISLAVPDALDISIRKLLEGIADNALVERTTDPLAQAVKPGRVLAWCDVQLATSDALPIAMAGKRGTPLLEALLPTLAPPAGVAATDVQVLLHAIPDHVDWRFHVTAKADHLKIDTLSPERKVIDLKQQGPGFDFHVRLLAVGDDGKAAQQQVCAMGEAFAATAQTLATARQRLRATRVQTLAITEQTEKQVPRIINGVLPPRNPKTVPLWSALLGRAPRILSAAEVATLWHPPTSSIAERVARIPARWLPVPDKAFVDPHNPRTLVLGHGRTADGSWQPIGFDYAELRYVAHMTAPMGRGKSVWLQHLFGGILKAGAGGMLVDCKGTSLINDSLPLVPLEREKDVIILSFGGTTITGEDLRVSMNLLSPAYGRSLGLDYSTLASTVLGIFATLDPRFNEAVGIKQFANHATIALLAGEPHATMAHLIRFFGDETYRSGVVSRLPQELEQTRDFWERRFAEMSDQEKNSLRSFERRLDQLLTYPQLAAMLVAPGCSIDMRRMMDSNGILMAGVKATEGQIASIGGTLLLLQMIMAALSRDNIPEPQRADWPVIIDEAHIIFGANPDMAKVMFSQLRSFRIGQMIVHQNLGQMPPEVMIPLAGNAQYRIILGSESVDAGTYASQYRSLGVTPQDFTQMERFQHQYVKMLGTNLFSSRMLGMPEPFQEDLPPPVTQDWRQVRAPASSDQDRVCDDRMATVYARLRNGERGQREAITELGTLCRTQPATFDAYCARTAAHRAAQRQFILDHPGCIPLPDVAPDASEQERRTAQSAQKDQRVRILSALRSGVPRIETAALSWALLQETKEASARAAANGKKKKPGSGGSEVHQIEGLSGAGDPAPIITSGLSATDIKRARGKRRAADDVVAGFDDDTS